MLFTMWQNIPTTTRENQACIEEVLVALALELVAHPCQFASGRGNSQKPFG